MLTLAYILSPLYVGGFPISDALAFVVFDELATELLLLLLAIVLLEVDRRRTRMRRTALCSTLGSVQLYPRSRRRSVRVQRY